MPVVSSRCVVRPARKPKSTKNLVKERVHIVRPVPVGSSTPVRTNHVVECQQVRISERVGCLGKLSDGTGVTGDLRLRENDPEFHAPPLLTRLYGRALKRSTTSVKVSSHPRTLLWTAPSRLFG